MLIVRGNLGGRFRQLKLVAHLLQANPIIGAVAGNVSKFHGDSRATDLRAVDSAAGRARGARYTGNRLRKGKHNYLSERATVSHPAFNAGSSGKW